MFSSSPSAQTLTLFWLVSPFFSLASASRLTGGSAGTAASNTGSLHSSSSDIGWNKTTTSRPYTYGSTASSSSSMGKSPGTVVSAKPSYPSSHGSVGWNNAVSAHGTGIAGGSGIGTGRMYGKNATTATPTKPSNSSLPFCKISSTTSSVNTKPTSWVTGACRQTTFMDPPTTLACATTTYAPLHATGCACPDTYIYERLSGGDSSDPCHDYIGPGNGDQLVPIFACDPVSTTPTGCIMPPSTSAPVSSPPPNGGSFPVSPTYPSTCTASTVGFSSTKALQTGSIMIDPSVDWGKVGSVWTFKAGGGASIDHLNNTSNPGTGSFSGNPEAAADNYTKMADGSWTLTVVPNMPSLPLIAITSGKLENNSFPLTITSTVPCDKPVAQQCNVSSHDLNPDQWMAFSVNDFMVEAGANWTASKTPVFWDWFVAEYVGDGFATACTVDQDNGCGPLTQSCESMKPGPWLRQAYLFMSAMMTYSRYLHFAYQAFGQNGVNMGNFLPNWETYFNVPQKTQNWQNVAGAAASVVGILSVIGFAAAPFTGGASLAVGAVGSGLFGINSILNGAINYANAGGAAATQDLQFDDYAHALDAYKSFVNVSQQALVDTSNAVFQHGINITSIFKDGHLVGDNMIKAATDSSISGFVSQAATWMDHIGIWGLINQSWKANNNYIVFIPYGEITWYGGDPYNFQQPQCEDHFLANGKWNGTIYAACDLGPADHPGMAMFMVPQNDGQINEYNAKSFYDVQGYTVEGYTFSPRDVLQSSLAGYFQHGYDYNGTRLDLGAELAAGNASPLRAIARLKASDPGVFNLAVCQIWDTNYVPACTVTDYQDRKGLDPCLSQPAVCATNAANWTDPKTGKVQFFKDHVSSLLISELGMAKGYNGW